MKYILSIILFLLLVLPCSAFSLFGNQNGIYKNDITNAERLLFGRKNAFHSQENRLAMLERELFGTVQTGSVQDRISLINRVLSSREYQYYSPTKIDRMRRKILSSRNFNQNQYKRHVRSHGRMTGFEPPVHHMPIPNFASSGHYNSRYNQNTPYFSNRGIGANNFNAKIPQPYGYGNNRFSQRMR